MQSITLEDALHYVSQSDISAAPDGSVILYKTHRPVLESNDYEHQVILADSQGKELERLPGLSGEPVWLEDGGLIFAVQKGRHRTTVFLRAADGARTELFSIPYAASLFGADKDRFFFLVRVNIAEKQETEGKSEEERERIYNANERRDQEYLVIDEFPYWQNGEGVTNRVRTILFLYDLKEGLKQLTEDSFDVTHAVFDAQTDTVFFAGAAWTVQKPLAQELYKLSLKNGIAEKISDKGRYTVEAVGVQNGQLAVAGYDPEGEHKENGTALFLIDVNTGKSTPIASLEVSYGSSVFSDVVYGGGRTFQVFEDAVYFIGTWHEKAEIYRAELSGTLTQVTGEGDVIHSFCVTKKGIFYTAQRGMTHQEIYVQDTDGNNRRITGYNEAFDREKNIGIPEELSYRDRYGNDIVGYVLHPANEEEGKTYPAILDIHGGPKGAYGAIYYHEMQYWAAKGYYVLFANPSGGTGRGREFGRIIGGGGGSDYEDLMGFVDLALSRFPAIDETRLGVTGGSYGGFMTNWIIGHTDRFAAAASQRSTANNITEAANKDIAPAFLRKKISLNDPDPYGRLWELSPLKYIGKHTVTPTIFLHSMQDYRCYHVEALQMYAALQYLGVPTRLVLFKNEHHGLSKSGHPRNRLRRLSEITRWMDQWLMNTEKENGREQNENID